MRDRVVVVVHHDGERLPDDERGPHHDVAIARAQPQLRHPRDHRQRRLRHHAEERPYAEHAEGDAHLRPGQGSLVNFDRSWV